MKRAMYLVLAVLIILGAQTFSLPSGEGAASQKEAPVAGTAIQILVNEQIVGYAVAIKGIGDESEIIERKITDKGKGEIVQKAPGRFKLSDIVIKKYIVSPPANDFLYQWRRNTVGGKPMKYNGAIVFFDATMKPVARYNFFNAWPSQWKGISVDVQAQPLTEEFVLTVERIERVQ